MSQDPPGADRPDDDARDEREGAEGAGGPAESAGGPAQGGPGEGPGGAGQEPPRQEPPSLHPGRSRPDPGETPPGDPFSALLGSLFPGGAGPRGGTGAGGVPGMGDLGGLANLLGGAQGGGQGGAGGLPFDPQMLGQLLGQVQRMLSGSGEGPVNWELARDVARQSAAEGGDPAVGAAQRRAVEEALRTAELWLDGATDLPASGTSASAWSRAEWVEQTLPAWRRLAEPVAARVADAMAEAMASQTPAELRPMIAAAGQMLRQVGGGIFGMQLGQAVGGLAREVVAASDVGLPLIEAGRTALLPANVSAFGAGLGVPEEEVLLFLALREAAHARLFAHVPWLRAHLMGAVDAYARGIAIDTERIEQAVREVDPTDPEALQQALSSGMFEPTRSPAQQAALDRLETALALVEGWVDEVVDAAARTTLPQAAALREAVRRRRAAGGPAEHTLASLVGLELRPRRLRDAAALWAVLAGARGQEGRDAVWAHPDLLPTAEDLDDPGGFAQRRGDAEAASADVDAALDRLLGRGPADEGDGGGSPTTGG